MSREDAYKVVQTTAMEVWRNESLNFKDELLKNSAVTNFISVEELEMVFDHSNLLKNVNTIFSRTVMKE